MAVLRHLKIDHLFTTVWGGDNLWHASRTRLPCRLLLKILALAPAFMLGTAIDAETAQRARVPFILFAQGYRKSPVDKIPHDVALDAFSDLPAEINAIMTQS